MFARGRAWFCCVFKTLYHWQTWFGFLAAVSPIIVLLLSLVFLPIDYLTDSFRSRLWMLGALAFFLSVPGTYQFGAIQVEIIRPYLAEYLKKQSNRSLERTG
jgi:hypothetical protein